MKDSTNGAGEKCLIPFNLNGKNIYYCTPISKPNTNQCLTSSRTEIDCLTGKEMIKS